jgi:hypothetical protein
VLGRADPLVQDLVQPEQHVVGVVPVVDVPVGRALKARDLPGRERLAEGEGALRTGRGGLVVVRVRAPLAFVALVVVVVLLVFFGVAEVACREGLRVFIVGRLEVSASSCSSSSASLKWPAEMARGLQSWEV